MGELDINKLNILKSKVIDYIKKIYFDQSEDTVNEELTKHWFILPFLEALGYDTHSSDVIPEVKADFSKKGEKVDYELQVNDVPVAIIECKKFLEPLEGHINQLYRYFPTLEIHIGILTNGIKYWFFTDSEKDNVMDKKPFLMIDIAEDDNFDCLRDYTRDNILNAPVPSIENKRKQAEKERQQLEQQKEQELSDAKSKVSDLETHIKDMQADIEKYKANSVIVGQLKAELADLQSKLDTANANWMATAMELDEIKEKAQEQVVDEQAYNAMVVQQMIEKDNLANKVKKLEKENIELKTKKRQKNPYRNTDLERQRVPDDIADDMVELFPEELFVPESKILDPFCRYGELLNAFRKRAMRSQAMIQAFPDEDDRYEYISDNMLYAIVIDEKGLKEVTRIIHGTANPRESHVVIFGTEAQYLTAMKANSKIFLKEKIEELKLMHIDAVIGNPPYNNDMYIPFVEIGHQLATDCSLFITPAKWQAKGGEKNEQFRKNIVPYMNKIVYYSNPLDVFPDTPMCGDSISYYMIDKTEHNDKYINNELEEHWKTRYGLDNTCINIVKKIHGERIVESKDKSITPVKSYFTSRNFGDVSEDTSSRYYMRSSARCIKVPENVFKNTEDIDKYKVYIGHFITNNPVLHLVEPFVADVREDCLLGFGSKEKCESIISYYRCKLIWFLVFMTNCGNASKEAFVNVPDPGAFDHIFTDEELYNKYDLTPEEINIIESVIKERK